jgi:hypothetical protein
MHHLCIACAPHVAVRRRRRRQWRTHVCSIPIGRSTSTLRLHPSSHLHRNFLLHLDGPQLPCPRRPVCISGVNTTGIGTDLLFRDRPSCELRHPQFPVFGVLRSTLGYSCDETYFQFSPPRLSRVSTMVHETACPHPVLFDVRQGTETSSMKPTTAYPPFLGMP